jgi:hypothetical protein
VIKKVVEGDGKEMGNKSHKLFFHNDLRNGLAMLKEIATQRYWKFEKRKTTVDS